MVEVTAVTSWSGAEQVDLHRGRKGGGGGGQRRPGAICPAHATSTSMSPICPVASATNAVIVVRLGQVHEVRRGLSASATDGPGDLFTAFGPPGPEGDGEARRRQRLRHRGTDPRRRAGDHGRPAVGMGLEAGHRQRGLHRRGQGREAPHVDRVDP